MKIVLTKPASHEDKAALTLDPVGEAGSLWHAEF